MEDWDQQDESGKEKNIKRLKTLDKEVSRLEVTLNDFLRFVRLPKPDFQKNSLFILLNELLDFTEPESQQLNIEVIRDFDSDLPEIDVDAIQLKQALLNIVLNANQSMPSGGKITVSAYKIGGDRIAIDISDTGSGIPEDRINKLFNLFYSTKEDGTGIGLSITKRIIDLHNGKIEIKSKEGEGTTFSILLPIIRMSI